MRRQLLRLLATFAFRRAWFLLPVLALVTGLAVWQGLKLEFDTSLTSFLPPATAEATFIRELMGDYRKLEPVMVVLRARKSGHERDLIRLANELAGVLNDQKYFSPPVYKTQDAAHVQDLPLERLIQLLPAGDWDTLPQRLAHELRREAAWRMNALTPPGWLAETGTTPGLLAALRARADTSRGPTRMVGRDGYFISPDGHALLMLLYPVLSPEDGGAALNTLRFTRRCERFLFERHEELRRKIDVGFYGSIISTGQHIEQMGDQLALILRFAIPLAFLLFLLVFRKAESLLFIALPPAIGLVWTLGLAQLLFQEITGVTAMFLLIILAIGMEYTIQLYHRFTLELYRTHHYFRALSRSYVETGRGVLASAVLMSVLFLLLFITSLEGADADQKWLAVFAGTQGFAKLGLVAGLGIACNLLACLLALPLMAAIKHALARGRIKPVALYRFHLDRLYLPAVFNPRATLVVMLLIGVVLGLAARRLEFARNFAAISPFFYRPQATAVAGDEVLDEFPRPGRPIVAVVAGRNLQEALERNDRLEANLRAAMPQFQIFAYDSLRWSLPAVKTQQASLARLRQLDLNQLRGALQKAAAPLQLRPVIYEPLLDLLRSAQHESKGPHQLTFGPELSDELILNVQRHATRQGDQHYVATVIYPQARGFDARQIPLLERALSAGLDRLVLVGDPIIEREIAHLIKINLAVLILLSFFCIVAALVIHFRSVRRACIAFIPILFALISLGGAMALAGLELHFFTVIALPLILCLAMDHAMQFTQYYYDRQPVSVRLVMHSLARVMVLSGGTMALFIGTMTLTSYPGLRDFGSTLLLGLLVIAISGLMLLPALLQLFAKGESLWQVLLPEGDDLNVNS
jgi:predicted RND superfamily exporter protein